MTLKEFVKKLQRAFREQGETLSDDGDYGKVTTATSEKYDIEIIVKKRQAPKEEPKEENTIPIRAESKAPWLDEAQKDRGKKESDPAYNKKMSAKWPLVGLNLGTIAKSWAAWCGLGIAVWLAAAGMPVQKDGAAAKNWAKYGQAIEWKKNGLPRGAITYINHNAKCGSGSGNHVTMNEFDVAAGDIIQMTKNSKGVYEYKVKSGASFIGYGGNQGNTAKSSSYPVAHICAVRWPPGVALPAPVAKTVGKGGAVDPKESTR